ncbi:MAG: hypothetical protein JKY56_14675 [Kofleriaceae bacterium]|nr:hypothetical protein [Kofleriaceae bacterium]
MINYRKAKIARTLLLMGAMTLFSSLVASEASADKKALVESATLAQTISPAEGFIDDPFTFDSAGSRLLYVNSNTENQAQLVVVDAVQNTILRRVDIASFSKKPSRVEFALEGEHYLVWGEEKAGKVKVALIDSKGKIVRSFGPAVDVVSTRYQGVEAVVVHDVGDIKARKRQKDNQPVIRHSVGIYSVAKGKLLGKKSNLDLTGENESPSLNFRFKYWTENFTVAVGIKGGEWDRKEGQQSPDVEGWYSMPNRTFSKRLAIPNLIEHRQRLARLMKHSGKGNMVVVKRNLSGIDFVKEGLFSAIELAEPFHHYNAGSLVVQQSEGAEVFFTITIDPVHPDAAAERKAVKPWVDLYEYLPGTKKAVRRARMLGYGTRRYAWRANHDYWAIVPRHIGFERGGTSILLYKLD